MTLIRTNLGKQALFLLISAFPAGATDLPRPVLESDFPTIDLAEAELGQLLFYDPILSGNRNISCATCHHPRFGTSDGLSLGLGEGAVGLGPARHPVGTNIPEQRIPRNAPALFNLGARDFVTLFHDGRIAADPAWPNGIRTPMDDEMVDGFTSVLSAQTMFPVLSPDEMAGHYSENEIAKAVRSGRITGPGGAWDRIATRVAEIPEYRVRFGSVYAEIEVRHPISFADISNAIAGFIAFEWRSDDSPFDAVLRGEAALSPEAQAGADLFYGTAGCGTCHSGPFLSDQGFHAMGDVQLGPGKAERFESHSRDEGRMRVTGNPADRFAFRTPSLRNVLQTGPWGHAGGHDDLAAFIGDHARRGDALGEYQPQAILPDFTSAKPDWAVMQDPAEAADIAKIAGSGVPLSRAEIGSIIAFLETLSDPVALTGRLGVPEKVPSGLPVER